MRPLLCVLVLLLPVGAARAASTTVPVDVGLGPAAFLLTGPVFDEQPLHFGLHLSVEAILDRATLRKNQRRIPQRYRKQALGLSEVRIKPSPFIPDHFFLSPRQLGSAGETSLYGIAFRPLGLGLSLGPGPLRLSLGAGLLLTYAYVSSRTLPDTHFLRPGVDGRAELELFFSERVGVSFGWSSALYIPQELGSFGTGPLDQSIWHIGQGFVLLHVRFPYTVKG